MTSVVTATILSKGKKMNPEYNLMSIDIIKEVNKIPLAQIILLDGDASKQEFAISNTDFFQPGNELEIKLKYESNIQAEATVFQGIIIRHSIRADRSSSYLTIDLKDAAIKLTTQRKSSIFRELTDTEIIKKIIQAANLKFISHASTQAKYPEMVQFYATDWDFILSRADANGCWLLADDGKITLQKPELKKRPKHIFEYGIRDIYQLEIDADISHQYTSVESMAWDVKAQKMSAPQKATDPSLTQGNLQPYKLAKTINADNYQLVTLGQLEEQEMQAWADAKLIKSRLAMLQGRLKVPGFADIKPGDVMEVAGVGKKFNGKTLVTAIRHQVNEQGWQTDVQFGLSANWFAQQNNDIIDTPASGLVPAINGLQIGIVDKYEDDPDKQYRVKVNIPSIQKDGLVWARLASIYAGQERGAVFRPNVGDEVVLGFINEDPRQAVILGAMHSEKNNLPKGLEVTQENNHKGIITRENLKILFDDENKSIEISTSDKNFIKLLSKEKSIHLADENGNKMNINDKGIEINSQKDIVIKGENITIEGKKVNVN